MPLIKIFVPKGNAGKVSLSALHRRWCDLWKVDPPILRLVLQEAETHPPGTLVDIRAKAKADRTPDQVKRNMTAMGSDLESAGLQGMVRCELFTPELQSTADFGDKAKL